MKSFVFLLSAFFVFSIQPIVLAQKVSDKALESIREAVKLMDNGKPDEAIAILKEVSKVAPKTHLVPYELGYAYQIKGDLETATFHFREACHMKDANDQCYSMLGNVLDIREKKEDALLAYDEGLKKFPKIRKASHGKGYTFSAPGRLQ